MFYYIFAKYIVLRCTHVGLSVSQLKGKFIHKINMLYFVCLGGYRTLFLGKTTRWYRIGHDCEAKAAKFYRAHKSDKINS